MVEIKKKLVLIKHVILGRPIAYKLQGHLDLRNRAYLAVIDCDLK